MFEKAKGLKICKTIQNFRARGFLVIDEKMYLASNCYLKKIAVKCVIFFFQQIILNFF